MHSASFYDSNRHLEVILGSDKYKQSPDYFPEPVQYNRYNKANSVLFSYFKLVSCVQTTFNKTALRKTAEITFINDILYRDYENNL